MQSMRESGVYVLDVDSDSEIGNCCTTYVNYHRKIRRRSRSIAV